MKIRRKGQGREDGIRADSKAAIRSLKKGQGREDKEEGPRP